MFWKVTLPCEMVVHGPRPRITFLGSTAAGLVSPEWGNLISSAGQTFVAADARRSCADLWEYQKWAPGVAQQWQKCRILMACGLPVVTFPLVSH